MVCAWLVALSGCGEVRTGEREPKLQYADVSLTVRCPDAAFADAIEPMVRAWASRTGAKVALKREAMAPSDDSDLGVIPAAGLGEWAEPGLLVPLPAGLRAGDHPFQWSGVLAAYREQLVEWGGQAQAVPLAGDGFVIVYRKDRLDEKTTADDFQQQHRRPLAAPAAWEDFAEVAAFFAKRDGKPSLPPLPSDPDRLFDLFCRVASSFDRRAMNDQDLARRKGDLDVLAFHHSVKTGKPRLDAPGSGFESAADWLARLRAAKCLPPAGGSDDPVAALAENRAVLAVLSLDQLARLPRENRAVPDRFGLVALPGARRYHDRDAGKEVETAAPNYVPHFAGGRLGVVRTRCPHPDAAFDLLAELGGPARSAELVSTPGLGVGPFRVAHLDRDRLLIWLPYGFDDKRSKELQDAMRTYVGQPVKNPTFALRGPDRLALTRAGADAIRTIATGAVTLAAGLKQAAGAWEALDAKVLPDDLLRRRRRAAGLN